MKVAARVASPDKVGVIHIIGIGGIGMSGIAEILHAYGYQVQGSDLQESYVTERLHNIGITIKIGHKKENIENASIVVKSTAIKDDNPEVIFASQNKIPVLKRSEMLAELLRFKNAIAVSGTHGKTTTTSLIGTVLLEAQLHPTVINGGIINTVGSNVHIGNGDLMVVEADESDGTFIKVPAYAAVVTNIDPEHLDYYGDFDNAKAAYLKFMENIPFYGVAIACFDHPTVREIAAMVKDRRVISYGLEYPVDVMATNMKKSESGYKFDIALSEGIQKVWGMESQLIKDVSLPIFGKHNLQNSLAAIAMALELGVSIDNIKSGLNKFGGVRRRFAIIGEPKGIMVVDDYAHHPVEIKATLNAAKEVAQMRGGKVIAILQPHRYSRLANLMDDFSAAFDEVDFLFVAPVYEAGERPIKGVDSKVLISMIKSRGKSNVFYLEGEAIIAHEINKVAKTNDLVVFLGAGSITKWAHELPNKLINL